MPRVLVIHYDPAEGAMLGERLRRHGLDPEIYTARGTAGFAGIRAHPPDAIVLDLTRMPSYGRAFGALLREQKSTRMIPLVFVEGDPAKTRLVRKLLPDAVFTNVLDIGPAIEKAISQAPAEPVLPDHSRVPLKGKLGIRDGTSLALVYAPERFGEKLGKLPDGARIVSDSAKADMILLFVKSAAALWRELPRYARELRPQQKLWLIWPKRSSPAAGDLSMPKIAEACKLRGLSGYKICAVDNTWSGLAVTLPRSTRRPRTA